MLVKQSAPELHPRTCTQISCQGGSWDLSQAFLKAASVSWAIVQGPWPLP